MNIEIKPYTKDRIEDVVRFEEELRLYENVWGWEIDEAYLQSVKESFEDPLFHDSLSFLAYCGGRVVGRIDSSMIRSRFDGSTKAYLDWICVLKTERHRGVAQALLRELNGLIERLTQYRDAIAQENREGLEMLLAEGRDVKAQVDALEKAAMAQLEAEKKL